MNPIAILVLVFAIFAGILTIIFTARQKRLKETWKGKITEKKVVQEKRKMDDYHRTVDVYYLYIKLDDGTDKRMSVGKKLFDTFSNGDRIEKKAGSHDPVKV